MRKVYVQCIVCDSRQRVLEETSGGTTDGVFIKIEPCRKCIEKAKEGGKKEYLDDQDPCQGEDL